MHENALTELIKVVIPIRISKNNGFELQSNIL